MRGLRFFNGPVTAEAQFSSGTGLTVRRTELHRVLGKRAEECGVQLHWGVKRVLVSAAQVLVDDKQIRTRYVIGADGQNSPLRRSIGLHRVWYEKRRYGFRQHFRLPPWSDYVEVYWNRKFQVYVTPVQEKEISVAVVSTDAKLRLKNALEAFPELEQRLLGAPATSPEMGALTVSRRLRRVWKNNFALTGDASGSVDSVTGEGLCLAFKEAAALGQALKQENLSVYQHRHDAINRRARLMTRLLLLLSEHDTLRSRVLQALREQPDVFAGFLDFHIGHGSLLDINIRQWCQLGHQVLVV